jgi:excisionase family DNA binding protein
VREGDLVERFSRAGLQGITGGTLEALALRVAELLDERYDEGFLDVDGAAAFLDLSRKAIYRLVERHQLPHHRAGGRLLFDRRKLRAWWSATRERPHIGT